MFKFLDPTGATYYQPDEPTYYPLPGPDEKYGPWLRHPATAKLGHPRNASGPGRYHLMKHLDACFAPPNWWPWWAEGRHLVGENDLIASFHEVRLRRITPPAFWRMLRLGWAAGRCLARAYLRQADLHNANLSQTNLAHACLVGADLRGANLSRASLHGANLLYAKLSHSTMGNVILGRTNLCFASLRGADLRGASMYYANLCDCDLRGCDLRGAKVWRANFAGAQLDGADLRGAEFDQVYLHGVSAHGVRLKNATFRNTNLDCFSKKLLGFLAT